MLHTHVGRGEGGESGFYLSSSWMLWGGVGKEAGTSTVLLVGFNGTSRSPFWVRPCIQMREEV